jgi:hypothetical protein
VNEIISANFMPKYVVRHIGGRVNWRINVMSFDSKQ